MGRSVAVTPTEGMAFPDYMAAVSSGIFPMEIELGAEVGNFAGGVEARQLGCLSMVRPWSNASYLCRRLPRRTRGGEGHLILHVQETGYIEYRDERSSVRCGPGSMALIDPNRGSEAEKLGPGKAWAVTIPTGVMKGQIRRVDDYCATVIDGEAGAPALLRQTLTQIWRDHASLNEYDAQVLPGALLRLVDAAFHNAKAPAADLGGVEMQMKRLKRIVAEHLHDPDLSAGRIAAQMGVSRSSLYSITAASGTSVGRLMLDMRLERVREELTAPEMAQISLTQIAFSHGFQELSHFSRCFKARYGASPRTFRTQMLAARGG